MFELDVCNQRKQEVPTDIKAIKFLHSTNVIKTLYRTKTKRISDKAYREMYEDGGWIETPIVSQEYQVEELDENEHRKLVITSYGILLDILAYARDNLPLLETIEFDSSLKLGFLEPAKLANIAKNLPQGVNHLYLNDQGFAHVYSCKDAVIAFFSSLPLNLVTLQVSNMQKYIATGILKGLKEPQSIKHLILSDNKMFNYNKETLSKLFASIGKIFSLDTFEIINENIKLGILDVLLQHITAKNIVFLGSLNDHSYVAAPIKQLPSINKAICHLELSESIFKASLEKDNAEFVKLLFKLGGKVPKYLDIGAQQTPIAADLARSLLTFRQIGPLCSAWILAKNRGHAAPPIGKLSRNIDMLNLVSEMLTGYTKFKPNY